MRRHRMHPNTHFMFVTGAVVQAGPRPRFTRQHWADLLYTIVLLLAVALLVQVVLATNTACAEGTATHYPVAYVDVHEGSSLNVRRSPGGDWAYYGLPARLDVVILQTADGWALVATPERIQDGHGPLGWVSMDYLRIYRDYIILED